MALLQKLLSDRNEVVVLHQSSVFCSCGAEFEDFSDIENHVVQHPRVQVPRRRSPETANLILRVLSELSKSLDAVCAPAEPDESVLKKIDLPEKVCGITLEEEDLNAGHLSETPCTECAVKLGNFEELKQHFRKSHFEKWMARPSLTVLRKVPAKRELLAGWTFRFYCPIPGCKYHLITDDAKFFASRDQLKQHYSKVHAFRSWSCNDCGDKFSTDVYLRRHKKMSCGKTFSCLSCSKSYSAVENLKTHCRRKNHQFPSSRAKPIETSHTGISPVSFINLSGNLIAAKFVPTTVKDSAQVGPSQKSRSGPVKIAPKPSPLHLTAAIALSELARDVNDDRVAPAAVPAAGLTGTAMATIATQPLQERSSKVIRSSEVQTSLSGCFATFNEQETQTPFIGARLVSLAPCYSANSLRISDKLIWSSSSTQTSPRVIDQGELLLLSSAPDPTVFPESEGARRRRPPNLGEIEQFSTETQTDFDLIQMLKPSANSPTSDDEDDPMFGYPISRNLTEAETQFDLDDILCSNYTQTNAVDDEERFCIDGIMESGFSSSKTQTGCNVNNLYKNHHQSQFVSVNCQTLQPDIEVIHMETQTLNEDTVQF